MRERLLVDGLVHEIVSTSVPHWQNDTQRGVELGCGCRVWVDAGDGSPLDIESYHADNDAVVTCMRCVIGYSHKVFKLEVTI